MMNIGRLQFVARLQSNALSRIRGRQQQPQGMKIVVHVLGSSYYSTTSTVSQHDQIKPKIVDVPLVFVPGMKGTHLAFYNEETTKKKKRAWLTLGNLLNFPPRPDDDPDRDLSLPLTYDHDGPYPRQHRGKLVCDGIVDHIIELNVGEGKETNFVDLNFLPFYGHATQMLRDIDKCYHSRLHDGKVESTNSFQQQDDYEGTNSGSKGILDQVGSFIERSSNFGFFNKTKSTAKQQQSRHTMKHYRPTAVFTYDWRRPLPELCTELNEFCCQTFPNQPVQIVAHSLGGLMSFGAMRENPTKYAPGAVVVGVPFETGIQYLQDLHKGYYTELDRCRQFTPAAQFTMSSHWGFFPINKDRLEDRFVDVSERCKNGEIVKFDADKSGIGKKAEIQPKVDGENAWFDFYNADEWERLQLGVFDPSYDNILSAEQREAYKEHMRIQMKAAKKWRQSVLGEGDYEFDADSFPPFVACQSSIPTINQILRRRRQTQKKGEENTYEYDYINGRAVPGDGRIDYDKSFPPSFVSHKRVTLNSPHTKQCCWEEAGGSWGSIYDEVVMQAEQYMRKRKEEEEARAASTKQIPKNSVSSGRLMVNKFAFKKAWHARKNRMLKKWIVPNSNLVLAVRPRRFRFRRRQRG